ncbi:hypothetical protein HPB52_024051 [Rhipicephalus sanguineus]|uniref:Uncharacterized protein n=1 Tax=Rhipicephalus sanguineus TaxID=34632 RepID=A0A9D4T2Z5_RHISA|nr:hypothetical protein HPB52_024051 [Rhipicephalus sanguineus]
MSTDSPPLKKRKIRQCTFRKEWRSQPEYESWLLPVDDDATAARCTICASTFTVKFDGVSAVKHHASTQKHKQKSLASKQSATVKKFFVPAISSAEDHVTAAELGTIFHGIKHNYSYLSMDCGSKLAPKVFSDSDIASRMRLGRTKMEHLVKDVLAPYAVDGAGITDALIDFCEQADETSGGICELLATSLEKQDAVPSIFAFSAPRPPPRKKPRNREPLNLVSATVPSEGGRSTTADVSDVDICSPTSVMSSIDGVVCGCACSLKISDLTEQLDLMTARVRALESEVKKKAEEVELTKSSLYKAERALDIAAQERSQLEKCVSRKFSVECFRDSPVYEDVSIEAVWT